MFEIEKLISLTREDKRNLYIAALLSPFSGCQEVAKRPEGLVKNVVKHALKWPSNTAGLIHHLCSQASDAESLPELYQRLRKSRLTAGLWLREAGQPWRQVLALLTTAKTLPILSEILEHIENEDLLDVGNMKPILNGKELMSIGFKSGPELKIFLEKLIAWQIENPKGNKESAILWSQSQIGSQISENTKRLKT